METWVNELVTQKNELGKLALKIKPQHPAQWEAMEKGMAAHKQLRSIDYEELSRSFQQGKLIPEE